jgi:hypothetical protein
MQEPQIDIRNHDLVGVAGEREVLQSLREAEEGGGEVHQKTALEVEVEHSIVVEAVAGEHLIEVKAGEEVCSIEVMVEVEKKGHCLLQGGEVQVVKKRAVMEERVRLVLTVVLEVMEGEELHLLVGRNVYEIVVFLLMEVGVELRLGLVLEVVLYSAVLETGEGRQISNHSLLVRIHRH